MVPTEVSLEDTATRGCGPFLSHGVAEGRPLRTPVPAPRDPTRAPERRTSAEPCIVSGKCRGFAASTLPVGKPLQSDGQCGCRSLTATGPQQPGRGRAAAGKGQMLPRRGSVSPQCPGRRRQAGLQRGHPVEGGRGGPADEKVCCRAFPVRRRLRAADGHEHAPPRAATADTGQIADHTGPCLVLLTAT